LTLKQKEKRKRVGILERQTNKITYHAMQDTNLQTGIESTQVRMPGYWQLRDTGTRAANGSMPVASQKASMPHHAREKIKIKSLLIHI